MKFTGLIIILNLLVQYSTGQSREELFRKANEYQKNYRYSEALTLYKSLLKSDSNNVELLNRTSFLLAFPIYEGKTEEQKSKKYSEAYYLASKVIRINIKNAEGHYHMALALGRMSGYATTKTKISYARQIRSSCEKAISLNPVLPGPYHILARWHREVAGFNMLEKAMISAFYGGELEGGTYEEALKNFKISLKLDPTSSVNYYEIGLTYYERNEGNDREIAKDWLKKAIAMKTHDESEVRINKKAQVLFKKL